MTLPGMPIRAGDAGVFICGPADMAPWESAPLRPAPAVPRPRAPWTGAGWIVLNTCRQCNSRTGRYCNTHDVLWALK